jgi:hypothetical protein
MEKYEVIKALSQGTWGVVHFVKKKSTLGVYLLFASAAASSL